MKSVHYPLTLCFQNTLIPLDKYYEGFTFFQSYFFNCGNFVSSLLGFISLINALVGVPSIFII